MLGYATTVYPLSDVEVEIRRVILGLKSAEPIERPRLSDPEGVLEQLNGRLDALCELELLLARDRTVQVAPDAFLLADEIAADLHMDYIPRS